MNPEDQNETGTLQQDGAAVGLQEADSNLGALDDPGLLEDTGKLASGQEEESKQSFQGGGASDENGVDFSPTDETAEASEFLSENTEGLGESSDGEGTGIADAKPSEEPAAAERIPFVDFIPPYHATYAETPEGRITQEMGVLNERLGEKELLMLAWVEQDIHVSYYKSWRDNGNAVFRTLCRLNRRRAAISSGKTLEES